LPSLIKFPPSVEIKRAIAAATRAGIVIRSIEIEPRKITIHPLNPDEPVINAYDKWKMEEATRKPR
jgi:hypothetical protein